MNIFKTMAVANLEEASRAIPVIDFGPALRRESGGLERVAREVGRTSETVGFFYLAGHPVPQAVIDDAFQASREFHAIPLDEKLALRRFGEPVELQRVFAHVQVRVQRHLVDSVRLADRGRRRSDEIADAADVQDETFTRVRDGTTTQARDQPATTSSSGGASAWQIATASASAAWVGEGGSASPRMTLTIFCTCTFSARP